MSFRGAFLALIILAGCGGSEPLDPAWRSPFPVGTSTSVFRAGCGPGCHAGEQGGAEDLVGGFPLPPGTEWPEDHP